VIGCGFVVQAVYFFTVEIRDAFKVASVQATESCFIHSAAFYIISWNAEEWHPQQNQFRPTLYHTFHVSVVEKKAKLQVEEKSSRLVLF